MGVVGNSAMSAFEKRAVFSLTSLYAFRMLGLFMVVPVLVLYGDQYQGSTPFLLGLALGIYGLTQALLQIPFGAMSDRFGRKPIIAMGLVIFALGSVVAASSDTVYGLIVGRAMQGAGAIAGAIMAMVGDLTGERQRTKAMASIGMAIGVSFAVAIVLGPAIANWWGLDGIFWLTAILALAGIGILVGFVPPVPSVSKLPPLPITHVLFQADLQRLNFSIFALHFCLMASFVVVPSLLLSSVSISREDHWMIYLPVMLLSFVLMVPFIIWSEKNKKHKSLMIIAATTILASQFGFAWGDNWFVVVSLLVFFVGFNLLEASLPSMLTRVAPMRSKGAASGVYSSFQFMGTFAGGTCGGWLLGFANQETLFYLCAGLLVLVIWVVNGLKVPAAATTIFVDLHPERIGVAEQSISMLAGVREVIVIEAQAVASIRIDEALFSNQQLDLLSLDAPLTEMG